MSVRRFKLRVLFAAGASAVWLSACGNTSSSRTVAMGGASGSASQSSGGVAGGGSSNGAGTAGALGGAVASGGSSSSGASNTGDTPAEACIAYNTAVCKRQAACGAYTNPVCDQPFPSCPDLVFSSGSTRTVADLKECAKAYATLPCEQVAYGVVPPCVTPGTRQAGEKCMYASQCASLYCANAVIDNPCGTCQERIADGQPCPMYDGCAAGSYCNQQGMCAPGPPYTAPKPLGAACAPTDTCADFGTCQAGICALVGGENTECDGSVACAKGYGCALSDSRCHALPPQGQSCLQIVVDVVTDDTLCADGACYRDAADAPGMCGPYAKLGEPCVVPIAGSQYQNVRKCEAGTHCNGWVNPQAPTCATNGIYGAACVDASECLDGFACQCPLGESTCDQSKRTCHKRGNLGDLCDAEDVCQGPFACENGRCVPGPNQGLFEQRCGK